MDTDTVVTETLSQAVARQAAEIERLREVESNTTAAMIEWEKRWRSTAQENERLRKDFSDLLRVAANDASEHQAEIERLRDHVKFLNSFRPDAELAKRDAEIERLRGLLRDVDDGLDDYWVTTKEGVAWICARNEALGE